MKSTILAASAVVAMALAGPAFAQGTATSGSQASSQGTSGSSQNLAAAQKIQQDLKNAGFTDVKVVAESFVVQAKTKDGNPVVMTIGPHGMSVFEAMNANGAGSNTGTTGSNTGTSSSSSSQGMSGTNSSGQNPSK
jgi:hypothetical protein